MTDRLDITDDSVSTAAIAGDEVIPGLKGGVPWRTTTEALAAFAALGAVLDWTPTLTFSQPGDLAVTYGTRLADYIKIGPQVTIRFVVITSAFTHTTAAGTLFITGLPFAARNNGVHSYGSPAFQGITKASYTSFAPTILAGTSQIQIDASGSAQAVAVVGATDCPTGTQKTLAGTITYFTDD